jgi:hypothetical protein
MKTFIQNAFNINICYFMMVDYIYNERIRVRFMMNASNTVELLLMCMPMVFLCMRFVCTIMSL